MNVRGLFRLCACCLGVGSSCTRKDNSEPLCNDSLLEPRIHRLMASKSCIKVTYQSLVIDVTAASTGNSRGCTPCRTAFQCIGQKCRPKTHVPITRAPPSVCLHPTLPATAFPTFRAQRAADGAQQSCMNTTRQHAQQVTVFEAFSLSCANAGRPQRSGLNSSRLLSTSSACTASAASSCGSGTITTDLRRHTEELALRCHSLYLPS